MTNREPLRDSALSAPPFGYLSGSRVLRGSRSRQQPVSVATIKRGNYGLVETATARCELSGSSTVRGLFQRSGPLGPGSPDLLFWVKGERTVGKGERPVRPISMKYLSLYDKIFYMISSVTMDHKVVILLSYYEKYYEKKNRILLLNNYCRLLSKHKVRHCPWGVTS